MKQMKKSYSGMKEEREKNMMEKTAKKGEEGKTIFYKVIFFGLF